MRLGISSYAYAWAIGVPGYGGAGMDVFDFVRRAGAHGLRLVQIADNLPVHELGPASLARLRSLASGLGIAIQLGTRGSAPEDLLAYLRLCEALGSSLLRVLLDSKEDRPDAAEAVRRLRLVAPDFERSGVALAIENHDRFKARELARIIGGTGSEAVGSCIDSVNSFGAGEGTQTVMEALGPSALCLHVKDFAVQRLPHNMGFTVSGTPAGRGLLDLPSILGTLSSFGRSPDALLELWPPPESDPALTVAKEEAWVLESLAYLRGLLPD